MSIASILVSVACLFVFGVFTMLTININYMGEQAANQCQIQVFVDESITDEAVINSIRDQIKQNQYVKDLTYQSGDDLFQRICRKYSKRPAGIFFSGVPSSIISDIFKVTLTDISQTKSVADYISKIDGVKSVKSFDKLTTNVQRITKTVRNISIWVVIIFAFISIFIISNTIKLTVHNRRKEINIMKYVGATDSFIRGPFVTEGMLVGFIAAVIAFFLTEYGYNSLLKFIGGSAVSGTTIIAFKTFSDMALIIAGGYLAIGIGLGAVGSAVSMRKYLKV
ncbi:MAG: permease-like cell division protein FtsX [Clostridiales bacterium]|nr:MAG: permease-like cell division protein FtsX [Clostridiales bacterium]